MTVNALDFESNVLTGPYILACGHCNWTSLEIGMQFDRVTNIWGQIALKKGDFPNTLSPTARDFFTQQDAKSTGPEAVFAALKSFNSSQLSASNSTNPLLTPSGGFNYNSPSSLARIMSLYTGVGASGKKSSAKPQIMRESADPSEGLHVIDPVADANTVQKLREQGWAGTTSAAQRNSQPQSPRFLSDILPVPTLLRTKRSKRCGTCRHILVKPEPKVQSTRFKIKLIAISYIPTLTLKALPPPSSSQPAIDLNAIPPLRPNQFLLTLKNSLFESLRVTLATSPHTPGPHAHKVTILCPQFEIGPNADLWDEALNGGVTTDDKARTRQNRRLRESSKAQFTDSIMGSEGGVAEAGKVWDRGRNWTTVVLEVVCAAVERTRGGLTEDEDVLEIPILIRMEWDGEARGDGGVGVERGSERIELAYWVVIGVGRIAAIT
ncbi:hypothetical protein MMC07_000682 [Pseudocyphellaria aurata]|nr:hypothetical protein [Pseudocyphellaria aurata]